MAQCFGLYPIARAAKAPLLAGLGGTVAETTGLVIGPLLAIYMLVAVPILFVQTAWFVLTAVTWRIVSHAKGAWAALPLVLTSTAVLVQQLVSG